MRLSALWRHSSFRALGTLANCCEKASTSAMVTLFSETDRLLDTWYIRQWYFGLKNEVYKKDVKLDYVAMEIPNRFIVGFGLDYDELGRNIKDIYVLDE